MNRLFLGLILVLFFYGCENSIFKDSDNHELKNLVSVDTIQEEIVIEKEEDVIPEINYYEISAFNENKTLQAVIEIPAGTNHKLEYNKSSNTFDVDKKDGKDRVINFLPYPGNYGFIPSTIMDESKGGDGDALDVLVISESVETSTVMEIIPIAVIMLEDKGELDNKVIAVPADKSKRIINATDYSSLEENYPQVKEIIENWFLSYKGFGKMQLIGWMDDKEAKSEINNWTVN